MGSGSPVQPEDSLLPPARNVSARSIQRQQTDSKAQIIYSKGVRSSPLAEPHVRRLMRELLYRRRDTRPSATASNLSELSRESKPWRGLQQVCLQREPLHAPPLRDGLASGTPADAVLTPTVLRLITIISLPPPSLRILPVRARRQRRCRRPRFGGLRRVREVGQAVGFGPRLFIKIDPRLVENQSQSSHNLSQNSQGQQQSIDIAPRPVAARRKCRPIHRASSGTC